MKKKIIIISIISITLLSLGIGIFFIIKNLNHEKEIVEIKKEDEIANYNYYLDDNDTKYYKKLYNELKNILNADEINKEEYAKIVAKMFLTDLYTLDNKITSNDIGGLQFIYENFKENFIKIVRTTLYSTVKNNIYGDREQVLPIVTNSEIKEFKESTFMYQNNEVFAYEIVVSLEYKEDLGYQNECRIILIENDKYLQVASLQ